MTASSMMDKVEVILKKKEIEYTQTDGNIHIFQAKAHAKGYDSYFLTAEIMEGLGPDTQHPDDYIEWKCDETAQSSCHAFMYSRDKPRTCKHVESAKRLMKIMELRTEFKIFISLDDKEKTVLEVDDNG